MNGVGVSITLLAGLLVMLMPRRFAIVGVFISVCYITQGQQIDVGGFHFTAVRLVLLLAVIRAMTRGEMRGVRFNSMDWLLLTYAIFYPVVSGLRCGVWQESVGNGYNILFSYFAFRFLVKDWQDLERLYMDLALLIVPLAMFMAVESFTGFNFFNVMGGQEAASMREGRLRCIGSFRGPHTSGTFGASMVPLFIGLYWMGQRSRAVVGIIAATIITYMSNASGPLMAYLASIVGLAFWPMRTNMKRVKLGIVLTLVVLGFTMKVPIWYLLSKISSLTGGDGWYRSYLMDMCWQHMSDWWLMGTNDTSGWAVTTMSYGQADLCNVYVACAATSGMGGLILFILLLVRGFQKLGDAQKLAREYLPESEMLLWCLGCALFAHVATLFSVTYWDQMHVPWWGFLAIIASVTSNLTEETPIEESIEISADQAPGHVVSQETA